MIEFNEKPPKTPEDIQFTTSGEEQMKEAASVPSENRAVEFYFRGIGTSVGHFVIDAMEENSSVEEICAMAQGLRERVEEIASPMHESFTAGFKSAVSLEKNLKEVKEPEGAAA